MIILGIDPGTARMGYGFIQHGRDGASLVTYGVVTTSAHTPLPSRLEILYRGLVDLIDRHQPDEAAVEQLFFARNVQSALAVGHARGVALLALAQCGLPIAEYTPLQVKQSVVGYGRGDKNQVQSMVKMLLGMDHIPQPDDAADALAIAICHVHNRRMAQVVERSGRMIVGIDGVLESVGADHVVIGVGGISFKVSAPGSTLTKLPGIGNRVRLNTHLYVREDAVALFGFGTADELQLFELLMTVSGVGPRVALSLLSGISVDRLRSALAAGDADVLTQAPGVGKKLAARLVLELKGKVTMAGAMPAAAPPAGDQSDVLAALGALGYSTAEAAVAVAALPASTDLTVEDRIRLALRQLAAP